MRFCRTRHYPSTLPPLPVFAFFLSFFKVYSTNFTTLLHFLFCDFCFDPMIAKKRIYAQCHNHHTSQHWHHSQQSSLQLPKLLMPQSLGPTPALQQTQTSVSAVVLVVVAAAAAAYLQVLCCVDSALPQTLAPLPSARIHHLQPPQLPQLACNRSIRHSLHTTRNE